MSELPFPAVLDALFVEEPLPIHLLYRLSDLSEDDLAQFSRRWAGVADERRHVITRHLADISEDNYVVNFLPVFVCCMQDTAAAVRAAALDGVWDATNTQMIDPIIHLLQTDNTVEVQRAAASALTHYVLMAEWGQLPQQISPPIVSALLAVYDRPETAVSVKRAALEAISPANHARIPTLIEEAYESDDFDMQLSAVFAMGGSADSGWLPIILDEMLHHSAEMRAEAARAAGAINDSSAVPDLANLTVDEELDVALTAVAALGQIGDETAANVLTQLADDPDFGALHEAVDDALEEVSWLGGAIDLLNFDGDEFEQD